MAFAQLIFNFFIKIFCHLSDRFFLIACMKINRMFYFVVFILYVCVPCADTVMFKVM
jgi:hypothetical protein